MPDLSDDKLEVETERLEFHDNQFNSCEQRLLELEGTDG